MAKIDVVLGLQWGDEGKGKIVDVLAGRYPAVARFQGGPNAGHSLHFDGNSFVVRSIPSGIFREGSENIIGNGVVLDPVTFREECGNIAKMGIDAREKIVISKKAHLILPTHKLMDAAQEAAAGKGKIGSTLKGIGPTYTDKVGRHGLRVGDILAPDFKERFTALKNRHLQEFAAMGFTCDPDKDEAEWMDAIDFLRSFRLVDCEYFLNEWLEDKPVLAEGAQGSLLDIDYGSYPFVTSSNTTIGGVCTGLGVAPSKVGKVYGIFKAYCTRVGSGPFPTELFDETGEKIRRIGNEFGAVTGRPRRCGWLDLVALKYTVMVDGVTDLIMMKSDCLRPGNPAVPLRHGGRNRTGLYRLQRLEYRPHRHPQGSRSAGRIQGLYQVHGGLSRRPPVRHYDSEILGNSRPSFFFRSTTFKTRPRMSAATPRQASITNGAV